MNGPQDIGGKQGLGRVVADPDEPVFNSRWEARVFGLSFCSWLSAGVTVDQSRREQAAMPYDRYYGSAYYERWLHSLQRLVVEHGIISPSELESGMPESASAAPPIDPSELGNAVVSLAEKGTKRFRPALSGPSFAVGQPVRARNVHPRSYDRLPTYVKGRQGVVDAHHGSFGHPEDLAAGRIDQPGAHCYRVRFLATEVWGESAEGPEDALCVDLFEDYLEPA